MKKTIVIIGILLLIAITPLTSARINYKPYCEGDSCGGGIFIKPKTQTTQEEIQNDGHNRYSTLPIRTSLYFPFGKTANFLVGGELCSLSYNGFGRYSQKCSVDLRYEVKYQNWYRSYLIIRK